MDPKPRSVQKGPSWIGALGGALAGAALGSIAGPAGTLGGGLLGAVIGDEFQARIDPESSQNPISQDEKSESPTIVVFGVGGGGSNSVNRLHDIGVTGAKTIALDTNKQHLEMVEADTKILIGKKLTEGLGVGGDPAMGEHATEMAKETIREIIGDANLVFVTSGMGGGTGTGGAPVVSKIAKSQGAMVIGIVSMPFNVDRGRTVKAEEGLKNLQSEADSTIILDSNLLLKYVPNLPIGKMLSVLDQIIAETIKGICETITQPSLLNFDYADMTAVMGQGGVAVMLVGETEDKNKAEEIVNDLIDHPLLNIDYHDATGLLVHITGGPDLTQKEAEEIAGHITEHLEVSDNVIWGAYTQEEYKGKIRAMAVMTGIQSTWTSEQTAQEDQSHTFQTTLENTDLIKSSGTSNENGNKENS